jgi:hypothetical protein
MLNMGVIKRTLSGNAAPWGMPVWGSTISAGSTGAVSTWAPA